MNKQKQVIITSFLFVAGLFFLASCNQEAQQQTTTQETPQTEVIGQDMEKEEWVAHIFGQLTLEEKVRLTHATGILTSGGVPRLGISDLVMGDGPHGVRGDIDNTKWNNRPDPVYTATAFTSGIALAATWNPELAGKFGEAVGKEMKARGKEIQLGPSANIIRAPLGGRNFEYLSEDPHLTSKLIVPIIQNVQSQGIATCLKHYVANNHDFQRFTINVNMSKRALHEIYLPAFKAGVQEGGTKTVMGSYNKVLGQHGSHNQYTLNEILKGKWGFEGIVISDWDATHNTKEAHNNGLDIEMGTFAPWSNAAAFNQEYTSKYYHLGNAVIEGIEAGELEQAPLDDKAKRILGLLYDVKIANVNKGVAEINTPEHAALSRQIGQEAMVLLKNEGSMLPIDTDKIKTLAVIGEMAITENANGGGSSSVLAEYEVTPLEGIQKLAKEKGVEVKYAQGDVIRTGYQDRSRFHNEIKGVVSSSDAVVVVTGTNHKFEYEGKDRSSFELPKGQLEMLQEVMKYNKNVIMVLIGSGAVNMTQWIDNVPSAVQMWYAHQEGGTALADILFGDINPSGKLPVTLPKQLKDSPAHANEPRTFPGVDGQVYYEEGILVGYRYFDAKNIEPLFPFGHGLSYTQFDYSQLAVTTENDSVYVSFQLKNTGEVAGKETAQVYVTKDGSVVQRAPQELKAFQKVNLVAGEQKEVKLVIPFTDLRYYDEATDTWVLEGGIYKIGIGASSRDIRLNVDFSISK